MPGQLINRTLASLSQGVSEQFDEVRYEQQSEEIENCFLSLSRGLLRRNGTQNSFLLDIDMGDYFMYTYKRGSADYTYLLMIGHRKWYAFNVDTQTVVGTYQDVANIENTTSLDYLDTKGKHPREVFSLVTVGDFTWLSNNQIVATTTGEENPELQENNKSSVVYWIKDTGNVVVSSDPATGEATIEGYEYTLTVEDNTGTIKGGNHKNLIIGADQDLLNGSELSAELSRILALDDTGIYPIEDSGEEKYSWAITFLGTGAGSNYYWYDGILFGGTVETTSIVYGLNTFTFENPGYLITEREFNGYLYTRGTLWSTGFWGAGSMYGITALLTTPPGWRASGSFVYNINKPSSDSLEWSDSKGNLASFGFKGEVVSSDELPASLPKEVGTIIVKVGTSNPEDGDDYWLKWEGGLWKETAQLGLIDTINPLTMPHSFVKDENEQFTFSFFGDYQIKDNRVSRTNSPLWAKRTVGDNITAPLPSFINKKIEDIFIHNNRFGIIAEDSVVLSEISEFGNFFPTTVQDVIDSDPIDVEIATSSVTTLRTAVSVEEEILLLSDTAMFSLSGLGNVLTPNTATILQKASYDYNKGCKPVIMGNYIYFISNFCGAGKLYELGIGTSNNNRETIATDITEHVPNYLPSNIHSLVATTSFNTLFMLSSDESKSLYVCNILGGPQDRRQLAHHKWTFKHDISNIQLVNKFLYIQFFENDGPNGLSVAKIPLELPANVHQISYSDSYQDGCYSFPSKVKFSKWYLKDQNNNGNRRDKLKIRTIKYTVKPDSKYATYIVNKVYSTSSTDASNWILVDSVWDDSGIWSDISNWNDAPTYLTKPYYNDELVSVGGDNEEIEIEFYNNPNEPDAGFELSTVNWEGYLFNRGRRV